MAKIKIKVISIGHLPLNFQPKKISSWESDLFEIDGSIDNYALRCNSDGYNWEFSDELIKEQLPDFNADFLIAIVNVPIEQNWYSRRIGKNSIVITYHEIKDILENHNIPLENVIYRLLYTYSLVYIKAGRKIPDIENTFSFTHDETRGCLFDINGIKTDLIASCHSPKICDECQEKMRSDRVSNDVISLAQKEIRKIKKDLYYQILDFVKQRPIRSLIISTLFALVLGVAGSVLGSIVYEGYKNTDTSDTHQPLNEINKIDNKKESK
ncbi:MAG: hypothetical protein PHN45_05745 [Methylococcales bacterium]|nr:hypothetical protein [Methylococcales bacterium]MDD5754238.1 hypothetical protein [Methylococcales bacterium]